MNKLLTRKPFNLFETAFLNLVTVIFEKAAAKANRLCGSDRRSHVVKKDGGYKCIHLHVSAFLCDMGCVKQYFKSKSLKLNKLKFLDVGCGVGQKVYLANITGFQAFGIELRAPLVKAAIALVDSLGNEYYSQKPTWDVNQADALKYEKYGDYDVIYFYCPLFQDDLQRKLEERIAAQAKKGAVVIAHFPRLFFGTDANLPKGWTWLKNNQGAVHIFVKK